MQGNILSQLHDIQTPDPVSWWPLAWGWYAVAAIIIVAIWLSVALFLYRRKQLKAKKQALKLLKEMENNLDRMARVKHINNVLKRVVMAYFNRDEVADLSGQKWAKWLNDVNVNGPQFDPSLLSLAYQKDCTEEQVTNLAMQTHYWIKANLPMKPKGKKASKEKSLV